MDKRKKNDDKLLPTERRGIYKMGKGILINRDAESLKAYKTRKKKMNDIGSLKEDVDNLKNDINEIKQMIGALLHAK